jgi:hypothetical protein
MDCVPCTVGTFSSLTTGTTFVVSHAAGAVAGTVVGAPIIAAGVGLGLLLKSPAAAAYGIAGGGQHRPIMLALDHGGPAKGRGVLRPHAVFGGLDHDFLRHAADIDAGAAPEALLGHAHPGAMAGRNAGQPHPARAAADDEEIELISHAWNLSQPAGM